MVLPNKLRLPWTTCYRGVVSRNGRLVIVSVYKLLSLHVQNYGMDVTILCVYIYKSASLWEALQFTMSGKE